jgi:signal transduction histidine kinase
MDVTAEQIADEPGRPGAERDAPAGRGVEPLRSERLRTIAAEVPVARLVGVATALSGAAGLGEIADALAGFSIRSLGASGVALWLVRGDEAVLAATRGPSAEAVGRMARLAHEDLARALAPPIAGVAAWLPDVEPPPEALPSLGDAPGERGAWLGLPLRAGYHAAARGVLGVAFPARRSFSLRDRSLHLAMAHLASQAVERVRLFERESRGRTRAEILARISADLAAGVRFERIASDALGPWIASMGASDGALWIRDGDAYRCVSESPTRGRLGTRLRLEAAPVLARTVARQAPIVATRLDAQPHERACLAAEGHDACVTAPLLGRCDVLGLLAVGFESVPPELEDAPRQVETLAAHFAVALQRTLAAEREAALRRRLELAHELALALASARTTTEVVEVALSRGFAAFGASAGAVLLAREDRLEILGDVGFPPPVIEPWRRIPLSTPMPVTDAFRCGEPVWLNTRDEAIARYPAFASFRDDGHRAWAALPLVGPEGTLGVLGLSFARERPLDEDDRASAVALARTLAQALERARLYESERRMRREADAARAEAERIGGLQEQLLAVVGHDLRQPLSTIVLALRLLGDGRPIEAQHVVLGRVRKAAGRMTEMITDLLDLSRARHGLDIPVERERVDLAAIAARVVEEAETVHPGRVRLEASGAPSVLADRSRLGQVVGNLVSNAVEHGDATVPVRVRVGCVGDGVELEVHNGGVVPPHVLPRVFEPFARGGRRGLGLGLYIVREIVRAHGGSAEIHSAEETGTVVRVRLPLAPQA